MPNEYEERGSTTTPPKGSQDGMSNSNVEVERHPLMRPREARSGSGQVNADPTAPAVQSTAVPSEAKVSTDVETPGATTSTDTDILQWSLLNSREGRLSLLTRQEVTARLRPCRTYLTRWSRRRLPNSARNVSAGRSQPRLFRLSVTA